MDAEQRESDVGAARPDETGESEHLPASHVEGHIGEDAGHTKRIDPQHRFTLGVLTPGEEVRRVPPHHLTHQRLFRDFIGRTGRDVPPVAEHRDPIGYGEELLQPMCDEEDGHARLLQAAYLTEQAIDLVGGERRGRLVHDQNPHVERNRLGDLDCLLAGDGESGGGEARVDLDVELGEDPRRLPGTSSTSRPSFPGPDAR